MLSRTECETERHWDFWAHGNRSIILPLKWSNSTTLKVKFVLSASEWIEKTNATGLFVKRGKYGGAYAHKDIALEFASAIGPVFKLYLIKEFQRLKEVENDVRKIEWDAKRFLCRNNYLIQTDAVKNYMTPFSVNIRIY